MPVVKKKPGLRLVCTIIRFVIRKILSFVLVSEEFSLPEKERGVVCIEIRVGDQTHIWENPEVRRSPLHKKES